MKCHEVSHTLYTKFKNLHESFKCTIISRIKFVRSTFVQCALFHTCVTFFVPVTFEKDAIGFPRVTIVENPLIFFQRALRTRDGFRIFNDLFFFFKYVRVYRGGRVFSNSIELSTNLCRRYARYIKIIRTDEPSHLV